MLKLRICERPPHSHGVGVQRDVVRLAVDLRADDVDDAVQGQKPGLDLRDAHQEAIFLAPSRIELFVIGVKGRFDIRHDVLQLPAGGEHEHSLNVDRLAGSAEYGDLVIDGRESDTLAAVLRRVDDGLDLLDQLLRGRLVVAVGDNELDCAGTGPGAVRLAPAYAGQPSGSRVLMASLCSFIYVTASAKSTILVGVVIDSS